ncbi:hypothetical protein Ancab_012763, partial [Ancistrocladus abbreviatus]
LPQPSHTQYTQMARPSPESAAEALFSLPLASYFLLLSLIHLLDLSPPSSLLIHQSSLSGYSNPELLSPVITCYHYHLLLPCCHYRRCRLPPLATSISHLYPLSRC